MGRIAKPSPRIAFFSPTGDVPGSVYGHHRSEWCIYVIAADMRPYSVVENAGFKNMLNVIEPRYNIPSRAHFSQTVIPALCQKTKAL